MGFVLKQFEIGPMQNFGYLIGDEKTKKAFVVDPAWDPKKITSVAEKDGYTIDGLIVTHAHYDHTNAIELLLARHDVPVYVHPLEVEYSQSGVGIVGDLGSTVKRVEGDQKVFLGETEIRFLHTPGHTPGSQCILIGNYLVTGDTLFIGGCGRADLPGGDAPTLFKSLKKISTLSPQLEICPGHDYGVVKQRNLKTELMENPYLQMKDENQFVQTVN